jgi:hypothetical protein
LLDEALELRDAPPTSAELADAVECRVFRGATGVAVAAGPDVPPEVVEATTRYVQTVEGLLEDLGGAVVPRETKLGGLDWIVGIPSQDLSCDRRTTTTPI